MWKAVFMDGVGTMHDTMSYKNADTVNNYRAKYPRNINDFTVQIVSAVFSLLLYKQTNIYIYILKIFLYVRAYNLIRNNITRSLYILLLSIFRQRSVRHHQEFT